MDDVSENRCFTPVGDWEYTSVRIPTEIFIFLRCPRGKDVKTIQGLLRHATVTTTFDLYSQYIDAAKLEAQEDIALAFTSTAAAD